jgi:hypothetical protein
MQPTTRLHDSIPNAILQEANGVLHDPVAFHPTHSMFDPHANGRDLTIRRWLRRREFPTTWCLLGLKNRHSRQDESLKALVLRQTAPGGQGLACPLRQANIRCFAFTGGAQAANLTPCSHHQEVFECVPLLLATVVCSLVFRIFRPLDWSFSTIMPKRGDVAIAAVLCFASSAANSSAVRAGRRSWSANAWFKTGCNR